MKYHQNLEVFSNLLKQKLPINIIETVPNDYLSNFTKNNFSKDLNQQNIKNILDLKTITYLNDFSINIFSNKPEGKLEKAKEDIAYYKKALEESLAREVSLLNEVFELKKQLSQLNGINVFPIKK